MSWPWFSTEAVCLSQVIVILMEQILIPLVNMVQKTYNHLFMDKFVPLLSDSIKTQPCILSSQ